MLTHHRARMEKLNNGLRVTVTGKIGSGKTLLLRMLQAALTARGVDFEFVREENRDGSEVMLVESSEKLVDDLAKPIVWLVEKVGQVPYTTRTQHTADHAKATEGATVTPIYSALKP